jgi:phosphoglycerate dehydrogenase-like enzyme
VTLLRVHLLHEPAPDHLEVLKGELSPQVSLTVGSEPAEPERIQVLVAGRPSARVLEACRELEALVIPFAGVPDETLSLLKLRPHVSVYNLHHNDIPTAETALALLLSAAKRVLPLDARLRKHDWRPRYLPSQAQILSGRTALILGLGQVGQQLALYLQALGLTVVGIRKHPQKPLKEGLKTRVFGVEALAEVLPLANILAVTLPLTEDTRGLIGAGELALLPEGAVLVNVARGSVVQEKALYTALKSGHLHSAGLDVWYRYPASEAERAGTPPSRFPFHVLENVVLSPHRGGAAVETETLRMQHLARLINGYQDGERLVGLVDIKSGY